jgi:hypothetical protein
MDSDLVKISLMAEELGVSLKTVYNWVGDSKLIMPRPGYVNRLDAYRVWHEQQGLRSILSYFQVQGTKRDSNGRFISGDSE